MAKRLFATVHDGWLRTLFSSFAVEDRVWGERLYDHSEILYRHLKFIETILVKKGIEYSYERPPLTLGFKTEGDAARYCDESMERVEKQLSESGDPLAARIINDLRYIRYSLRCEFDRNTVVTAFDGPQKLKSIELEQSSKEALATFLMEESYKEYEHIVLYSYAQTLANEKRLFEIFQIMIDESKYHLKSFGKIMADFGILTVPKRVTQNMFSFESLNYFIENRIEEKERVKERIGMLAKEIKSEELQRFFTFMQSQDDYRIALLKEALETTE